MKPSIEWAAGLFEGEGYAHWSRKTPMLGLGTTDEDVLRAFQSVVGGKMSGKLNHKPGSPEHWKPYWKWWACGRTAQQIAIRLLPYMGARRAEKMQPFLDWEPSWIPAKCGTKSGAAKHRRNGEMLCEACREAERAYNRERRRKKEAV